MSNNKLNNELSAKLKAALLALDIPEGDFKSSLLSSTTTKSLSTSRPKSLHKQNADLFKAKAITREEREAEARRLAAAARPSFPDARVMFAQETICLSCGESSFEQAHPQVFLRLRRLVGGKFVEGEYTFIPESEMDGVTGRLPRLVLINKTEVDVCLNCFLTAGANCVSAGSTESSTICPTDTQDRSSESPEPLPSNDSTATEDRSSTENSPPKPEATSPSTPWAGSDSTSFASGQPAPAPASLTPTSGEEIAAQRRAEV